MRKKVIIKSVLYREENWVCKPQSELFEIKDNLDITF